MKTRLIALFSSLCLFLCAICPATAQSAPTTEASVQDAAYEIFEDLGFSAMSVGSSAYFCYGESAPDGMVFYYLWTSGKLSDYYDEDTQQYHIPYTDFIAIADAAFANHSDMLSYLGDRYDPETGIISWFDGGWGDAVSWMPLTYYEQYGYIYVTGVEVWFDHTPEEFDGLTYGKDWLYTELGNDRYQGMIDNELLMMAKKTDSGYQLLEYRELDYHIVDNVLYDTLGDVTYYPFTASNDNAYFYNTVTSQATATEFYAVGGMWATADKTMQFGVAPHLGYEIETVLVNGEILTPTADGTYGITVSGATELVINTVSTGVDTTAQATANEMFRDLGFCTWGENYFFEGEAAPDNVVFQYLQSSGALNDYYDQDMWSYSISYDEYIAIVDRTFACHSDMLDYLGDYYDPETGIVSWYSGGYGDAVTWQPLSYYEDGDYVYVTGVMARYDYASEDFADYTYGKDWLYTHQTYGSYAAMIEDTLLMLARKTENGLQIMSYCELPYHIVDGILYDASEGRAYCAVEISADTVYFEVSEASQAGVYGFIANGLRWVPKDLPMTFSATPHYGYAVTDVLLNGESILPDENDFYTVTLNEPSTLSVNTVATHQFFESTDLIVSPVPTVGDAITTDCLSVPEDAPYGITQTGDFMWQVSDTPDGTFVNVEDGAVFEAGKYYRITGVLVCNDGYALTKDAVATVNGIPATAFYSFGNHMGLSTEFSVHTHTLRHIEAAAPSYTQDGCLAHYECDCGRWFDDANGAQEIADKALYILARLIPEVSDGNAQVNEQAVADVLERDSKEDTVVLPLEEIAEDIRSVELPVASIQTVADAAKALAVQTDAATVTLDTAALQTIADRCEPQDTVVLSVELIAEDTLNTAQQAVLENKIVSTVLSAEILCGEETIHDFGGGEVTVQIAIEDEQPDASVYELLYIADDGATETYDAVCENGILTARLSHFSDYAVVKFPMGDVNGDCTLSSADARVMLCYFVGITPQDDLKWRAADLNGDGTVTTSDARAMLAATVTE